MCYGVSGTVDDKGKVRCVFTCSHDTLGNKPDVWRRKYWEWELHYPNLKKPVFTNEDEVGMCSPDLKKKVCEWCSLNQEKLKAAFGSDGDRQGPELFGKAKTGDLDFREAKTGDLSFWKARTRDLYFEKAKISYLLFKGAKTKSIHFEKAETGYLDFVKAKTGNLKFWEAKTGSLSFEGAETGGLGFGEAKTGYLYFRKAKTGNLDFEEAKAGKVFIKNFKPKDKWLSKKIKEFSEDKDWKDCTLSTFCKWLVKKQEKETRAD